MKQVMHYAIQVMRHIAARQNVPITPILADFTQGSRKDFDVYPPLSNTVLLFVLCFRLSLSLSVMVICPSVHPIAVDIRTNFCVQFPVH